MPHFRHNSDTFATSSAGLGPARMHAYVYKSQNKQDTYVYLAKRDSFDAIPAALRAQLLPLSFVLQVELTAQRRLAQADAMQVRSNLREHGFHLQFPPAVTNVGVSSDG